MYADPLARRILYGVTRPRAQASERAVRRSEQPPRPLRSKFCVYTTNVGPYVVLLASLIIESSRKVTRFVRLYFLLPAISMDPDLDVVVPVTFLSILYPYVCPKGDLLWTFTNAASYPRFVGAYHCMHMASCHPARCQKQCFFVFSTTKSMFQVSQHGSSDTPFPYKSNHTSHALSCFTNMVVQGTPK